MKFFYFPTDFAKYEKSGIFSKLAHIHVGSDHRITEEYAVLIGSRIHILFAISLPYKYIMGLYNSFWLSLGHQIKLKDKFGAWEPTLFAEFD
jgi:hypothetical protein